MKDDLVSDNLFCVEKNTRTAVLYWVRSPDKQSMASKLDVDNTKLKEGRVLVSSTRIGIRAMSRSMSMRMTSTIRMRILVRAPPAVPFYCIFLAYFIHPWVIFPISCNLPSISRYSRLSNILQFKEILKRIFKSSIFEFA